MTFEASDLKSMSSKSHLLHNDPPKGEEKAKERAKESEISDIKDRMEAMEELMDKFQSQNAIQIANLGTEISSLKSLGASADEERIKEVIEHRQEMTLLKAAFAVTDAKVQRWELYQSYRIDDEIRKKLIGFYSTQAATAVLSGNFVVPPEFTKLADIWRLFSSEPQNTFKPIGSHVFHPRPLIPNKCTSAERVELRGKCALWDWANALPDEDKTLIAFILVEYDQVRALRNEVSHPVVINVEELTNFLDELSEHIELDTRTNMVSRLI